MRAKEIYHINEAEQIELPPMTETYKLFDRFNNEFFDGSLPRIHIIYTARLTRSAGQYSCTINRRTREVTPKAIKISKSVKFTQKGFYDTLIHEMIHLYDSLNNRFYGTKGYDAHGVDFLKIADRINEDPQYKIHTHYTSNADYIDRSEVLKRQSEKPVFLLFRESSNGDKSMYYVKSEKTLLRMVRELTGELRYLSKDLWSIEIKPNELLNTYKGITTITKAYGVVNKFGQDLYSMYYGDKSHNYKTYKQWL